LTRYRARKDKGGQKQPHPADDLTRPHHPADDDFKRPHRPARGFKDDMTKNLTKNVPLTDWVKNPPPRVPEQEEASDDWVKNPLPSGKNFEQPMASPALQTAVPNATRRRGLNEEKRSRHKTAHPEEEEEERKEKRSLRKSQHRQEIEEVTVARTASGGSVAARPDLDHSNRRFSRGTLGSSKPLQPSAKGLPTGTVFL
jgi:hypothetical protein